MRRGVDHILILPFDDGGISKALRVVSQVVRDYAKHGEAASQLKCQRTIDQLPSHRRYVIIDA